MKKLTFKVSINKDIPVALLIKEVNKISCQICFDIENGFVEVENVNDTMIDMVIELVNKHCTILRVDIDNVLQPLEKDEIYDISKDDIVHKKISYQNEYIEKLANKLLTTVYWAMFKNNAFEKDIGNFIYTCISDISMRYQPKETINFSIGDIVECNYGTHLPGEINGFAVQSIVCGILDEDIVYVVPIIRNAETHFFSKSYLEFTVSQDLSCDYDEYTKGIVLLDKGRYINVARLKNVVGKTTPAFLEKILLKLAVTFDFRDKPNEIPEYNIDKPLKEESALLDIFGSELEKIDKSKELSEKAKDFMEAIGMSTTEDLVIQSFSIACKIRKVNYENVIRELRKFNSDIIATSIRERLKVHFSNWLKQYPDIAEKFPNISLMSLLKLFVKRFS